MVWVPDDVEFRLSLAKEILADNKPLHVVADEHGLSSEELRDLFAGLITPMMALAGYFTYRNVEPPVKLRTRPKSPTIGA